MARIEPVVHMKLIADVDISTLVQLDDMVLEVVLRTLVSVVDTLVHRTVMHNEIYECPYYRQHFHLHF